MAPMTTTEPPLETTPTAGRPESLREVIDVIPARCLERSSFRAGRLIAWDALLYAAVMVGLVFADAWWLVGLLWLASGLVVSALFVLGHDAAHGALFPGRRANDLAGRLLMLPSLHLAGAWKLGHNYLHHRHTARQGMDFVWHPVTPTEYAEMGRLSRLRHRLDWSFLGAGAYYVHRIWWTKMIRLRRPPARFADAVRTDRRLVGAFSVAAVIGAGALGGLFSGDVLGATWMVTKLIIVPFLLFCWSIGFTVYVQHIHPDMPWATRRGWNKVDAQLSTTTVFRLPRPLASFYHSIFVHVPHHVDPRIPCYHLEEANDAIEHAYPDMVLDEKLTVRGYVSTTRACKLFDFEGREWHDYASARRALQA